MCGIVAGIAKRNISAILLEGLRRLEYRGYDSAGMAIINPQGKMHFHRAVGKVAALEKKLKQKKLLGNIGIAHTRWATHGMPSDNNAHPQLSDHIAVVHNGIIENYQTLKDDLIKQGYQFQSDTDTEVIAHLIHSYYEQDLYQAVKKALKKLQGAYALAVISQQQPHTLFAVRHGCPLVVGAGIDEFYISSDALALRQVTDQFFYPKDDDIVRLDEEGCVLMSGSKESKGSKKTPKFTRVDMDPTHAEKNNYRHFMAKEIHEQPSVAQNTAAAYLGKERVLTEAFGIKSQQLLKSVKAVTMVACGSSYFATMVAKQWIESWLAIPCSVEIASEFLYRDNHVLDGCLFVAISQSGETADTLAALRKAKKQNYIGCFGLCNVPNSSLTREVDCVMITQAGYEISVASTKAFLSQLVALQLLVLAIGHYRGIDANIEKNAVRALKQLPSMIQKILDRESEIITLAQSIVNSENMLFLGRGIHFAIACEGALKMKELSYIHAEAYPSGELKHGPLALVSEQMPVIAIAPNNTLLKKLQSNLKEVTARGGKLYVISENDVTGLDNIQGILRIPSVAGSIMPMCYTVPLQLLAYHVAVIRGNDVDQPRNLAKSVTVE
ncbi:MAG: glutamine--fructose-6-phosphate transaminase (isomerizing) [Proteobacteria bacterium]|nr:glutamine--fructose-6-phosphate transaminase (isomerizing) [Pseudomonadota bacterium]MCH9757728.1 glutamine--fructose-6-phosphate transaminase (isomerizing) [Pseudomonadota bacterium]